jgi:hypothetical protein
MDAMAPARFHPDQLLPMVSQTYQSIDLRVAAVREGDTWWNAFAVLRFCSLSPLKARAQLKEALNGRVRIETDHFRIETAVLPYSSLNRIQTAAREGSLHLGKLSARLREPLDWRALQPSYLRVGASIVRSLNRTEWPGVEVVRGQTPSHQLHDDVVCREVASLGYEMPYDAIAALCGANVWPNTSHSGDVYIWLPVYACITDGSLAPTSGQLTVGALKHRRLKAVQAAFVMKPQPPNEQPERRWTANLARSEKSGSEVQAVAATVSVGSCDSNSIIEVKLVHKEIGEIDRWSKTVSDLLPRPQTNPLFEALKRFCDESQLEALLIQPSAVHSKRVKESAAFEHHVAWMLNLLGFRAIALGEYERLAPPGSKVQQASVDILALSDSGSRFLVVGCTLNVPKTEDFTNLRNACAILRSEVFPSTTIQVVPVLFTPAMDCSGIANTTAPVSVIDGGRLREILGLLRNRQERGAADFFSIPFSSDS